MAAGASTCTARFRKPLFEGRALCPPRRSPGVLRPAVIFCCQLPMLVLAPFRVEEQRGRGRGGGEMRVKPGLIDIVEEREHPVIILLQDGIELVIVAASAFKA